MLNFGSDTDESVYMKSAVFRNPNSAAKHVEIALNGSNPHVLLAALESPAATDIQILRGIGILQTRFSMRREELRRLLSADIKRYDGSRLLKLAENARRVLGMTYKQ
ncbi:MAG: hypothetical protein ABSE71_01060 [Candidatus Micrarchaeaceae archaeon]